VAGVEDAGAGAVLNETAHIDMVLGSYWQPGNDVPEQSKYNAHTAQ
jgi:hypothetical protein